MFGLFCARFLKSILNVFFIHTCVVCTTRYNHISKFLRLRIWKWKKKHITNSEKSAEFGRMTQWLMFQQHATNALTGEQNSSKAGFTNVIYWFKMCSKSRPLSLISRTTEIDSKFIGNSSGNSIPCLACDYSPLRERRVSESVSTNNFMWNRSLMAGK